MSALPAPSRWQGWLDRHTTLFGPLGDGRCIGIARRADLNTTGAELVAWEARGGRLVAIVKPFTGYEDTAVDVLLVGNDEAIEEIGGALDDEALPVIKRMVRRGDLVCYMLRGQKELMRAGFEDILLCMGIVFSGGCR